MFLFCCIRLEAHENDPDIDDEFVASEGQNVSDTGNLLLQCNKLLVTCKAF
jgi:hypothetical protein